MDLAHQLALAWQLAQAVISAPIVGARKVKQLQEVIGAVDVALSADEIALLRRATALTTGS